MQPSLTASMLHTGMSLIRLKHFVFHSRLMAYAIDFGTYVLEHGRK